MSADNLAAMVLGGLSIIGFMVAINTRGRIRMGLSYVLATILLLCTTGLIIRSLDVHRIPGNAQASKSAPGPGLQRGDEPSAGRRHQASPNQERKRYAAELTRIATHGTECANLLLNKDLKDESVELDTLIGRAGEMVKRVGGIRGEFERSSPTDAYFEEPYLILKDGVRLLSEASQSYIQYYYSEDSSQELSREHQLRLNARAASEKFHLAGTYLVGARR